MSVSPESYQGDKQRQRGACLWELNAAVVLSSPAVSLLFCVINPPSSQRYLAPRQEKTKKKKEKNQHVTS